MPNLLDYLAVLLYESAVHAIHHGCLVLGILEVVIECLGLGLGHTVVVVAGRCEHEIFAVGLVDTLGHHRGLKDGGEYLCAEFVYALALS